ncbi:MAG: hypothetical protein JO081_14420 [Alphaproteobacteria bacterium]|nr:hypothetical protein [Alphaproteobacteria bacterium]
MIPGVQVAMGGREWTVPPLTLGKLRWLMPKLRQLTDISAQMDETQIAILIEVVIAAMQRNYPDLTAESVENLLDLGNAAEVLRAVLTGSGLREHRPGEAMAVATNSDGSTVFSPPPADTPIP